MVVTNKFPLDFSKGNEQDVIIDYIKGHFGEILGDDIKLLDQPNGLDLVLNKVQVLMADAGFGYSSKKAA